MNPIQKCQFKISNVSEEVSLGQIFLVFSQFKQLKNINVDEVSPKVFVVSIESSNIMEIESNCNDISAKHNYTLTWVDGHCSSLDVVSSHVDEPKPQLQTAKIQFEIDAGDVPFFEIYSALSKVGHVNKFKSGNYSIYTINIDTMDTDDLQNRWSYIFEQFNLKIHRIERLTNGRNGHDAIHVLPPLLRNAVESPDDDYLRKLCMAPEIDLMDLTAFAHTCKRFEAIAKEVFKKKFDGVDLTKYKDTDLWRIEEFFRTFGDQITSISHCDSVDGDVVIVPQLIFKYCCNLKKLVCSVRRMQTRKTLRRVLPLLDELTILNADKSIWSIFDANSIYSLKKLTFTQFKSPDLPALHMPYLHELRFEQGVSVDDKIVPFIKSNSQLQKFAQVYSRVISTDRIILSSPNLIELELEDVDISDKRINCLRQIKQLQKLHIYVNAAQTIGHEMASSILNTIEIDRNDLKTLSLQFRPTWKWNAQFFESIYRFNETVTCLEISLEKLPVNDEGCFVQLMWYMNQLQQLRLNNCILLEQIPWALSRAERLKKADILIEIKREDLSPYYNWELVAIDAYKQKTRIELHVEIRLLRSKPNVAASMNDQYKKYGEWLTFTCRYDDDNSNNHN